MVAAIEDFASNLDAFLEMYKETMDRTCASPYYYFPAEYFRSLKDALGDRMSLCIVRDGSGEILSGALLTECSGIVQYHLSGTYNSAIQLRPSKLMLDYARTWGKRAVIPSSTWVAASAPRKTPSSSSRPGSPPAGIRSIRGSSFSRPINIRPWKSRRAGLDTNAPNTEFFPVYRG